MKLWPVKSWFEPPQVTAAETITVDKWAFRSDPPVRRRPTLAHLLDNVFDVSNTSPETVTADRWAFRDELRPRLPFRVATLLDNVFDAPSVSPEFLEYRDVLRPRTAVSQRPTDFGCPFVSTNTVPSVDGWAYELARPTPRPVVRPWLEGTAAWPVLDVVTVDRWAPPTNVPPKGPANRNWLYPGFWVDPALLLQPENINIDKWWFLSELPMSYRVVRDAHLVNGVFWNNSTPAPPPPSVGGSTQSLLGIHSSVGIG